MEASIKEGPGSGGQPGLAMNDGTTFILPHSEESEQYILGGILQIPELAEKAVSELTHNDFYDSRHGLVFLAIEELVKKNKPIDEIAVYEALKQHHLNWKVPVSYLGTLRDAFTSEATFGYHLTRIRQAADARKELELFERLRQAYCNGASEESKGDLRQRLIELWTNTNISKSQLQTISWDELIGKTEPELEFLIEDLLPVGCLLILAGKPKLGKSLLALLFAISVSLGMRLWNKRVNQGGVLFISTEDGVARLNKRIWKMLGNPDRHNPNFHFFVGSCILTDSTTMDTLKSTVEKLKPKLIVLDPLINLFRGYELNSGEDMNQVLRPLQELAKETGACVLVIHHARKSSGDDSIDIIQGSITIAGVADGLLILKNLKSEDEEKKAVLEVILKDTEIPSKVILKLNDNLCWNVEGEFEEITNKNLGNEIIKALAQEDEGLTIANLMQITGYEYKQLYRCLLKLESEGKVQSTKLGRHHTKVYSLENDWKTKMENEKAVVSGRNDTENDGFNSSFSTTLKSGKRNEQVENEKFEEELDSIPEVIR